MVENVINIVAKSKKSWFWNTFGNHGTKLGKNESTNNISMIIKYLCLFDELFVLIFLKYDNKNFFFNFYS